MKPSTLLSSSSRNEFLRAIGQGALLGAFALLLVFGWKWSDRNATTAGAPARTQAPASAPEMAAPGRPLSARLPDFGAEMPSRDVRHIANWSFVTGDHRGKAVVILDKKAAKVYVLDGQGRLLASTPALLGSAVGDEAAPGIGDKPLSAIRPEEKTTHAGRFMAQPGVNADGEDVIWVDHGAALSMHRLRGSNASERRPERLASPTEADNRISNGCINVPGDFFESVLAPAVGKTGAVIYVLPETRTPEEVFGSWDVTGREARPS